MWKLIYVMQSIVIIVFMKSIIIGSEFNFLNWIKFRKKYTNWYFNREQFKP